MQHSKHSKLFALASWSLRGLAAFILLQTLFFKFSGARESVYIFTTLGIEPWGRIASGVVELIASILLLLPRTVRYGALLAGATVTVAILSHATKLGITIPAVDDRGELFALAVVVLLCSCAVLVMHRHEAPILSKG